MLMIPNADNHKPTLSSDSAPNTARLKPTVFGQTSSYDLTYNDGDDKYAFSGARNTDGNQYVLYFDPERKAFILDRIDSTFNMNVTRLPENSDPESLKEQYPPLGSKPRSPPPSEPIKSVPKKEKPAPKPRAQSPAPKKKEVKRKTEKKQPAKPMALSLPKPEPPKPKPKAKPEPKRRSFSEDEDEDEDGDGGLLVEYPGAEPKVSREPDFSPAFPAVRSFNDFMDQRESEGDDADGEDDDEPDIDFKLPSPANHQQMHQPEPMEVDEEEDAGGFEDDLEDELEKAFEDLENSNQGTPDGDESEISEED